MKRTLLLLATILVAIPAAAQKGDRPGCKDDPLFPTRMPNYRIEQCETKSFDFHDFFTLKPPKKRVEGELTFITYTVDRREDEASDIEVIRNYENALKKIGAKIQGVDPRGGWWVNGTLTVDGKEVWAEAQKGNGKIWLRIVRTKEMEQTIVADAAGLANDLKSTGHVAVHGIYFDTNKSDLKPESAQAVGEIAKMLKADPSLKVYVVGHTDTVGNVEANLKLSQARAEAVVQALSKDGIAPARLKSFGNGPFAPVASNATEDGKAKNRRVELVKQ
ncbi:MAG TPA: OmpA family protein [Thermoanaerobaculia bacterium]|nr:OmpA family protein [Thermoanaerobaculia bacterium]